MSFHQDGLILVDGILFEEMRPNKNGVAVSKNAHAIECKDTLLRSESVDQELVELS